MTKTRHHLRPEVWDPTMRGANTHTIPHGIAFGLIAVEAALQDGKDTEIGRIEIRTKSIACPALKMTGNPDQPHSLIIITSRHASTHGPRIQAPIGTTAFVP